MRAGKWQQDRRAGWIADCAFQINPFRPAFAAELCIACQAQAAGGQVKCWELKRAVVALAALGNQGDIGTEKVVIGGFQKRGDIAFDIE